jgi:hypothetical protein
MEKRVHQHALGPHLASARPSRMSPQGRSPTASAWWARGCQLGLLPSTDSACGGESTAQQLFRTRCRGPRDFSLASPRALGSDVSTADRNRQSSFCSPCAHTAGAPPGNPRRRPRNQTPPSAYQSCGAFPPAAWRGPAGQLYPLHTSVNRHPSSGGCARPLRNRTHHPAALQGIKWNLW